MKTAPRHMIYESVYSSNILPVTSVCNVSCIFCSHRQNPEGIEIYRIPHQTPRQVAEYLEFITPENRIVIGESVTRIIEGEPLTNPYIMEILSTIRRRFPHTTVQITTNGTLIGEGFARFLADLEQVEINLSLNSASLYQRKRLMRDREASAAVKAPGILARFGIPYHGSIVAMPHVTGWEDLGKTINYLADNDAKTIRVFLPGFTRLAPEYLKFEPDLWNRLWEFTDYLGNQVPVPVTTEPPVIKDITPVVRGVMKDSPVHAAGLRKGDVINRVNGQLCISRADAFYRIKSAEHPMLDVSRDGAGITLQIDKKPGWPSGLVMDHDIDPWLVTRIVRAAGKYQRTQLLCSELGEPVLRLVLREQLAKRGLSCEIVPVKNRCFGGSIMCAGLLMVSDFITAVKERAGNMKNSAVNRQSGREAILVPAAAFDREGRDLAGDSYLSIEEYTAAKVEII